MATYVLEFYIEMYNDCFYILEKQIVPKILVITVFSQNSSINHIVHILNIHYVVGPDLSMFWEYKKLSGHLLPSRALKSNWRNRTDI